MYVIYIHVYLFVYLKLTLMFEPYLSTFDILYDANSKSIYETSNNLN